MDKKSAMLNITVSLLFNILVIVANFIAKRTLINSCGDLANGYYSLLMDIVDIFTLFEAGVGSAILFAMYSPIINEDYVKLYTLYRLFRKIYFIIFILITLAGLCFTPFIYFFVKDAQYEFNTYFAYIIVLISISTTHLYSYKTSIFNANKKNYIVTLINLSCQILMRVGQIVILYLTKNFILFLSLRLVNNVILYIIYFIIGKKKIDPKFKDLEKIELPDEEKKDLVKNVKSIAKYKIGGVLGNTLDSVIISLCINVLILGFFSNYRMLVATAFSVLQMIFTSINAVIGHSLLNSSKEKKEIIFSVLQKLNFIIGFICFVSLYSVINDVIVLWLDESHIIGERLVILLICNYFLQYTLLATRVVKESAGLFYFDRNLSLIEGLINFVISIILVQFVDIEGVMIGTIVTNICFAHIVEPLILFKKYYGNVDYKYYIDKTIQFSLFIASIFIILFIKSKINVGTALVTGLVNGLIAFGMTFAISIIYILFQKDIISIIKNRRKKYNEE